MSKLAFIGILVDAQYSNGNNVQSSGKSTVDCEKWEGRVHSFPAESCKPFVPDKVQSTN